MSSLRDVQRLEEEVRSSVGELVATFYRAQVLGAELTEEELEIIDNYNKILSHLKRRAAAIRRPGESGPGA